MRRKNLFIICLGLFIGLSVNAQKAPVKAILNADQTGDTISRHIYGHFSEHLGHCIYGGIWVGEKSSIPNTRGIRNDVVAALKRINIPNLRWPGGCFADEYHWRDGIGPRDQRPKMVNTNWGGVVEDNSFGTHEFLDLCEQLGTEPYISANLGSGTVEEMSKWVEYMTFDGESPMANLRKQNGREKPWKVKFFGIGNENWGCGGNMTAQFYADQFKRYATYSKDYGTNKLLRIAGGPSDSDYTWMETMMKNIPASLMQGVSLHNYTLPRDWSEKGSSTVFDEKEYYTTIQKTWRMDEYITQHTAIMDRYDPQRKVGLMVDEWGAWYNVEPGTNPGFLFQQNTMRDALIAAINLNIFNNHAGRVKMSNIAQIVNVLQSIIFTKEEKMVLTPTFYVFEMYKVHHDAALLPLKFESPMFEANGRKNPIVSASASRDSKGLTHITLSNSDLKEAVEINIDVRGAKFSSVTGTILTAPEINTVNTFEKPETIKSVEFKGAKLSGNTLSIKIPAKSVILIELK